ncbi:response regulator [Geobacter sp.]|uniref:response regulator n=1 Tax=Geobacter sp. TaxID=46610 RepID=UPI0027B8B086|nr:response regulator [Geobacter sp.]
MSLVGSLEDLGLGEILQILSLSCKSGILRLHSRGREGTIVFRLGQVIQAASSTLQENIGEVLIRKGKLDLGTLRAALAQQEREGYQERLGSILVRSFGFPLSAIDEVAREQVERVVYTLFAWAEGTFEFELQDNVAPAGTIRMDPLQFMLDQGLNPQFLALEGARVVEKEQRAESLREVVPPVEFSEELLNAAFQPVPVPDVPSPTAAERGTLILVDDDGATRDALGVLLERNGYQVISLSRSDEAFIQIDSLYRRGERPSVLVDLIMPRMDGSGILGGLELLELVWNTFPDLRVLVMSDHYNGDAVRRVGELGYSHILKPRRAQISDPVTMEDFAPSFLAALARLAGGAGSSAPSGLINLGDELRLEMGEEFTGTAKGGSDPGSGMTLLRGMLEELHDPALGGGITLLVLRFAAEFMERAVIFMVTGGEVAGLGQFGLDDRGDAADQRVRLLRIPRGEPSLFTGILEARHPAVVRPEPNEWNRYLFDRLGGGVPHEVFLGPIVSEGEVVAILYGDNHSDRKPIAGTEALEIFLSQAGRAMEMALLERKLMDSSRGAM